MDHPLPPLIYCPHIFQVQNYSFLHLYRQFKQDLPIHLPDLIAVLNSAFSSSIGYSPYSSTNPTLSFDSNPIPLNSNLFHTEPCVVQDLSVRLTAQSVLPLQLDWYGPSEPSTSYMVSTQSNPMTSTSRQFSLWCPKILSRI